MRTRFSFGLVWHLGIWSTALSALPVASASGFTFTKLVDTDDPLPGHPGQTFVLPAQTGAAGDGKVAFVSNQGPGPVLWTINDDASGLTYMISYTNTMPEGTNGFGDIGALLIAGGRVLFAGDDYPRTPAAGFFSMPFTGSLPTVLVNGYTTIPGSTGAFMLNVLNTFTADTTNLAFGVPQGCFSVPTTSGTVSRIEVVGANVYETNYTFDSMGGFALPAVSGPEVLLNPFNAFGQGAVYLAPLAGYTGTNGTRVASVNVPVPSDPEGRNFSPSGFSELCNQGGIAVFRATAGANNELTGIYSWSPRGLIRLVDTLTPVPGGAGTFQAGQFGLTRVSLSAGNVAFWGTDANGHEGVYLVPALGGAVTKVIAIGDSLPNGRTVNGINRGFYQPPIGPGSLDGTNLVIRLDFTDPNPALSGTAFYLASFSPQPTFAMTSSGTQLTFYSPSLPGLNYALQSATNLFAPVWADVGTAAPGTGNVLQFAYDRSTSSLPVQFFRLRLTSAP